MRAYTDAENSNSQRRLGTDRSPGRESEAPCGDGRPHEKRADAGGGRKPAVIARNRLAADEADDERRALVRAVLAQGRARGHQDARERDARPTGGARSVTPGPGTRRT